MTLEAALNRADQALYRAKAQGRGQIVIEPMGTSE
jgi:PleD family two-component response regulator